MKPGAIDFRRRLLPILLAQAVGLICGIIGVRLTSHLVAPTDFGFYGIFSSLAAVGFGVIYAGLIKFVTRYWQGAKDEPGLLWEIAAATWRRFPWLVLTAGVVAAFIAPEAKVIYGLILLASMFLLAVTQLTQSALQARREHWRDLAVSSGASLSRSFLPPLLYSATGAGLVALLGGFLIHAGIGALLGLLSLRRWWSQSQGSPTQILRGEFDGPRFVVLAAAGWALLGLNRWLVAWFFGAETAGYFTLANNVGAILPAMLGGILLQYFLPLWFGVPATTADERRKVLRDVDRVALGYTLLATLTALAVHGAMPYLVGSLISERYVSAIGFVLATGCSGAALMIGTFYHNLLLAAKREQACTTVDLGGAVGLVVGSVVSAAIGLEWFRVWLVFSPLAPWLINRSLARRALFRSG